MGRTWHRPPELQLDADLLWQRAQQLAVALAGAQIQPQRLQGHPRHALRNHRQRTAAELHPGHGSAPA